MPTPAYTRTALLQLIRDRGPMSAAELTEAVELSRIAVNHCINNARANHSTRYFRIAAWRRQETGKGGREIPVYGLGPAPDEPRPELGAAALREAKQRYADRFRVVINARARMKRSGLAGNPFAGLLAR